MPCLFPPSRSRPHSNMAQSVSAHAPPLARASHPRARGLIFVGFQRLKRRTCHIYFNTVFMLSHRNNTEITSKLHFCWLLEVLFEMCIDWTIKSLGCNIKRAFANVIICSGPPARRIAVILVYKLLEWKESLMWKRIFLLVCLVKCENVSFNRA